MDVLGDTITGKGKVKNTFDEQFVRHARAVEIALNELVALRLHYLEQAYHS